MSIRNEWTQCQWFEWFWLKLISESTGKLPMRMRTSFWFDVCYSSRKINWKAVRRLNERPIIYQFIFTFEINASRKSYEQEIIRTPKCEVLRWQMWTEAVEQWRHIFLFMNSADSERCRCFMQLRPEMSACAHANVVVTATDVSGSQSFVCINKRFVERLESAFCNTATIHVNNNNVIYYVKIRSDERLQRVRHMIAGIRKPQR